MTITRPSGIKGPIHAARSRTGGPSLPTLLNFWGVRKIVRNGHKSEGKTFSQLNEWELSDLFDRAKSVYRSRISKAHTDHGGDHELATALNCAWDNTERLFRKHGVEI